MKTNLTNLRKLKAQSSKRQKSSKLQAPMLAAGRRIGAWSLGLLLNFGLGILGFLSFSAHAQFPTSFIYSNDFNGSTSSNLTLTGTATVNGGYLKLTTHAPNGQLGNAFIDGLPSLQGVRSFRATFKAALFGGTVTPADGYSFSLAPVSTLPLSAGPGEEGTTTGLSISFDTYDNGGEPPSISVLWNGSLVGQVFQQ